MRSFTNWPPLVTDVLRSTDGQSRLILHIIRPAVEILMTVESGGGGGAAAQKQLYLLQPL